MNETMRDFITVFIRMVVIMCISDEEMEIKC